MRVMTCAWCGNPFIQENTPNKAKYCCRACQVQAINDHQRFRDTVQYANDALSYYKYLLRKIVKAKKVLWESLAGPQWDHMIEIHDTLLSSVPANIELQNVDTEIGKILAMPAVMPISESMRAELKLYCKRRYPKHLKSRK